MDIRKAFARVEVKDAEAGTVSAVFATLGVVDKDGDVTVAGAFTDGAAVLISTYGHASWDGALPVGKGTIRVDGNDAILDGQFFMNTSHGRDTFETVKAVSEHGLQEWSYSLHNVVSDFGTFEGQEVRFLRSIDVREVSPVLVGAGVNTRTLAVKAEASKFSDVLDGALVAVKGLSSMAVERLALRAEQGKSISEQVDALGLIEAELEPLRVAIAGTQSAHNTYLMAAKEFGRYQSTLGKE